MLNPRLAAILKAAIENLETWIRYDDSNAITAKALTILHENGLILLDKELRRFRLATFEAKSLMQWDILNSHLIKTSERICNDNDCTEEGHNCGSFAYFRRDENGEPCLIDISVPDYITDSNGPVALPLPRDKDSNGLELKDELTKLFEELDAETSLDDT